MKIGVPKEIKNHEYRVGLIPSGVKELVHNGHEVSVETNAGAGIGYSDSEYLAAGAQIMESAADIFNYGEMIIKVKDCLLYTSPSPRDLSTSRMPSSA